MTQNNIVVRGARQHNLKNITVKIPRDKMVVITGISGSGNSVNVVKALQYAEEQGAHTVAFCGFKGGKVKEIAKLLIHAPIHDMEITEDVHIIIFHALKQSLIRKLKGDHFSMGTVYDERVK